MAERCRRRTNQFYGFSASKPSGDRGGEPVAAAVSFRKIAVVSVPLLLGCNLACDGSDNQAPVPPPPTDWCPLPARFSLPDLSTSSKNDGARFEIGPGWTTCIWHSDETTSSGGEGGAAPLPPEPSGGVGGAVGARWTCEPTSSPATAGVGVTPVGNSFQITIPEWALQPNYRVTVTATGPRGTRSESLDFIQMTTFCPQLESSADCAGTLPPCMVYTTGSEISPYYSGVGGAGPLFPGGTPASGTGGTAGAGGTGAPEGGSGFATGGLSFATGGGFASGGFAGLDPPNKTPECAWSWTTNLCQTSYYVSPEMLSRLGLVAN